MEYRKREHTSNKTVNPRLEIYNNEGLASHHCRNTGREKEKMQTKVSDKFYKKKHVDENVMNI